MRLTNSVTAEEFERRYSTLFETNTLVFTSVMADERLKRLVAVWPLVRREYTIGDANTLEEVWRLVKYSPAEWARKAGVPLCDIQDEEFEFLKLNGVVLPDGTIPETLRNMLVIEYRDMHLAYLRRGLEQNRGYTALKEEGER